MSKILAQRRCHQSGLHWIIDPITACRTIANSARENHRPVSLAKQANKLPAVLTGRWLLVLVRVFGFRIGLSRMSFLFCEDTLCLLLQAEKVSKVPNLRYGRHSPNYSPSFTIQPIDASGILPDSTVSNAFFKKKFRCYWPKTWWLMSLWQFNGIGWVSRTCTSAERLAGVGP